jgi:hypothetical protein
MLVMNHSTGEILEKIAANLAWPPKDGREFCWLWVGGFGGGGKPQLTLCHGGRRKTVAPARVLFELEFQTELPRERYLRRTCGNPACVNPSHGILSVKGERLRDAQRREAQEASGE